MKLREWIIILYFCFIAVSEVCSNCKFDDERIWKLFKKVHHKKYCRRVDIEKKRVFDECVNRIIEHNLEYDLGLQTYRKGLHEHSDMSHQMFSSRMNGFLGTPESRKNRSKRWRKLPKLFAGQTFPRKLDYRGQGLVTSVKNQGQCGSCWAFSAVASMESQTLKATNQTSIDLSEQNLVDCSSKYGNKGCKGGLMINAFDYIIKNPGIDTGRSYPYEAKEGPCRFQRSEIGAMCSDYDELNDGSEKDLLTALVQVGPISVGINGKLQSFQDYKGGVYDDPNCGSRTLDHAVLLIGYGTDNGKDYWLIKNSYGTSWGENGYAKMARNQNNQCGIATQATYPIVKTRH